jgi:hypothetical protein
MNDLQLATLTWQPATLEIIGWLVSAVALVGVVLNNRRRRACFCLWWISNAGTFGLHLHAGMIALACRDLAFFVLAVQGFFMWSRAKGSDREPPKGTEKKRPPFWNRKLGCWEYPPPTTPKPDIIPPSQNRRFATDRDGPIAREFVNLTGQEITPAEVGLLRQSAIDKVQAELKALGNPMAELDDLELHRRMMRTLAEGEKR